MFDANRLFTSEDGIYTVSDERAAEIKKRLGRDCDLDPALISFKSLAPYHGVVVLDGTYIAFWIRVADYELPLLWPIGDMNPCVLVKTNRKNVSLGSAKKPALVLEARVMPLSAVRAFIDRLTSFCKGLTSHKRRVGQIGIAADGDMLFLAASSFTFEPGGQRSLCDIARRQGDGSFVWSREERASRDAYRGRPNYYAWRAGNQILALHDSPPDRQTFVCWDDQNREHVMTDVFMEWISTATNAHEMADIYTIERAG